MLKRLKYISPIFLLLALASISIAQTTRRTTSPSWRTFTSEAGEFSIDLPGIPKHEARQMSKPGITLTMHSYQLVTNSNIYLIGYADMPPSEASMKERLEAGLVGMVQDYTSHGGKELAKRYITSSFGCPGIDWAGTSPPYPIMYVRMYGTSNRMYFLIFGSNATKEAARISANKFFDSFSILGSPCTDEK